MLEELKSRAKSVVLEVDPRLVPLFARSMPGVQVIGMETMSYAGRVDAHTPIASLGRYLRPNWESFPRRERGYLVADAARTAKLRERLRATAALNVGLSWQSINPLKTAQLHDFNPLFGLPECGFIDLQYGDTRQERLSVKHALGVSVTRLEEVDNSNDIDGLAALITACDAVVTVSNTTAHLAGALGKPTWVLVPFGNARIWYWFRDRPESPWYPHVHVRRQAKGQSWDDLISSVYPEIADYLRTLPSPA
jgi:hypothetical protein